jgi:hypothetical protein
VIAKPFDPPLRDAPTGEEELFNLMAIEVTVMGEGNEDRDIAVGKGSNEARRLLLGEAMAGVGR